MADQNVSIQVKAVSKHFVERKAKRDIAVFDDFDLEISGNELLVIVGPSGGGKTTLLKMMAGLVRPDSGEIEVMGRRITGPNPFAITIFQEYSLFPWRTALGNVELPLEVETWKITDRRIRRTAALEALAKVGLRDRSHSFPKELSGGMQQRVALARSLVVKPKILLMDEPFGSLDAQTRADMQRMLVSLWMEIRNLVVFVTHDIEEALILADRVVVLSERPARILDSFQIEDPRPRDADFLLREQTMKLRNKILNLLYKH